MVAKILYIKHLAKHSNITSASRCELEAQLPLRNRASVMRFYVARLPQPRDGTGSPGHGSPGQRFWPGRVGSRVGVSDQVFDPVLSLTCAFIVALFLHSNTISAN